jgi:phosphoadenosine phosphosulfate reductase
MNLDQTEREAIKAEGARLEGAPLGEILGWAWERFGERAGIGTSFQGAGLVVIHTSRELGYNFPVFTLDTGLLFPETLALKAQLEERFGIAIESLRPEQTVAEQAAEHGEALWSRHPDLCCTLRKVLPLQRKLAELDVWITGVRRQQSDTRSGVQVVEIYKFDVLRDRHIIKLNPMAGWTRDQVQAFLREHGIPSNALLEKGYRSIGCMPCTRPVAEGEDERAGRWTGFDKAECGIHTFLGSNI